MLLAVYSLHSEFCISVFKHDDLKLFLKNDTLDSNKINVNSVFPYTVHNNTHGIQLSSISSSYLSQSVPTSNSGSRLGPR